MNEFDYITSGFLEDYCLGLLTNQEGKSVESIFRNYPEFGANITIIR